ncbi:T9SS type A sorting domain-containing protein [Altibacter sp. HG106]|uniref:T9SS type A sorting domain-containing protein n=1 Tax=Altibacter sp. HG106 TaxID=3023937 RepID=UPI00235044E8|nr:T9SS type A sorting domain-containing protein [Altibacter sp. HG106]MDC7995831.1 T9SS type A sorting domain-containing protein [Altibacter sp. HG106]
MGFAVGGDYNTSDDSTFTVYFRDDYYNSCDRPITYTELRFDKVNFGADDTLDVPVSIYPNPSEEFIQIEIPITITIASIELYDIQGKRLDVDISDNYQMDVSQLRSGMYVVHINTTNGALTKTVVKR